MHLYESPEGGTMAIMNAMLPGVGFDWNILGNGTMPYTNVCTYSAQFESIVSRWEASDFGLLQPVVPGPGLGLLLAHGVQMQQAGKSEQELLFRSGAARQASNAGMAAFTNDMEEQSAMEEQT